jgi:hypothetical protein
MPSRDVCMQWLRGEDGCSYGVSACSRKHYKDQVCKEWLNSRCKYSATECKYIHGENVTDYYWLTDVKCVQFKGPNSSWQKVKGSWQYVHNMCSPCDAGLAAVWPRAERAPCEPPRAPPTKLKPLDEMDDRIAERDEMDDRISDLMKLQLAKKTLKSELDTLEKTLEESSKKWEKDKQDMMFAARQAENARSELEKAIRIAEQAEKVADQANISEKQAKEAYANLSAFHTEHQAELMCTRERIQKKLAKIERRQQKKSGKAKQKECDKERVCCICLEKLEKDTTFIFIECGHMCICENCNTVSKCPMCQTLGKARKVFM